MTNPNRFPRCAALAFLLLLSSSLPGLSQTPATALEGSWEGTLGGKLRLVLTITKSGSGEYKGIMDSIAGERKREPAGEILTLSLAKGKDLYLSMMYHLGRD